MNRPSHWILLFFALLGGGLWSTGVLPTWLDAAPSTPAGPRVADGPVVVHLDRAGGRRPDRVRSSIDGVVVDRLGWPVEDASVRYLGSAIEARDEMVRVGADGQFALDVVGRGRQWLAFESPTHQGALLTPSPVGEPMLVVLEDRLPWRAPQPDAAPEVGETDELVAGVGYLKTADGDAVANGFVRVRETEVTVRSDQNGRFMVPLPSPPAACHLVAWDVVGGLVGTSVPIQPDRRQGKWPVPDIELTGAEAIRGRLRDADGNPAEGVLVVATADGDRRQVRSGRGGVFTLSGLIAGEYELRTLPHRGFVGLSTEVSTGDQLIELELERPRTLQLTVVDEDAKPRANVHVVVDEGPGVRRAYDQADERGVCTLRGLGRGTLAFEVRAPETFTPLTVVSFDAGTATLIATD